MTQSKMKALSPVQHFYREEFRRSRASNFKVNGPIWPEIELVRDFMFVFITCKFEEDQIKNESLSSGQHFLHYKSKGAIGCRGNSNFDPVCPKALCYLSLNPVMLHIKFDQDWPAGHTVIQKFESVAGQRRADRADHWYAISPPCEPSGQMS